MTKIKRLLLALFVLTVSTRLTVHAQETANNTVYGEPFFLRFDGFNVALFSNIVLDGPMEAELYVFFSNVTITENGSGGGIHYFSSDIVSKSAEYNAEIITPLITAELFNSVTTESGILSCSNIIPPFILELAFAMLRFCLIMMFFSFKHSFFEQGFCVALYEVPAVITKGTMLYFFAVALIVVFFLSAAAFPASLLIIALIFILTLLGEVSASLLVGYHITVILNLKKSMPSYAYLSIGAVILEGFMLIPYINQVLTYVIMPVVSLGIICVCLLNALMLKKFYYPPISA